MEINPSAPNRLLNIEKTVQAVPKPAPSEWRRYIHDAVNSPRQEVNEDCYMDDDKEDHEPTTSHQ